MAATKTSPAAITFTGYPTGDCECSCWVVIKKDFVRLTGDKPTKDDRIEVNGKKFYMVYLDQLILDLMDGAKDQLEISLTVKKSEKCKR